MARGALPRLATLYLHQNRIADRGAVALAEAVTAAALPSLTKLWLFNNRVAAEGMQALAAALGRGGLASLESLSLANNPADEEAAKAVVEVLSKRRGATATPLPSAAPVNEFSRIMGTSLYG